MAEFDRVAPVYDATRRPPTAAELDAVLEALAGQTSVLEAGVGTGRFAVPLGDHGVQVTGIDISLEMMRRAREKGVPRLLRADLHHLPFPDAAFDASLIIHVLQLIPEPLRALKELARVSRNRVVAVFPDRPWGHSPRVQGFRGLYREIAAEKGYVVPERTRYWDNARKLLEQLPPSQLTVVSETVTPDPDRERAWRDARAFGGVPPIPEEVHQEIIAEIRRRRGDQPPERRERTRRLQVAWWESGRILAAPSEEVPRPKGAKRGTP